MFNAAIIVVVVSFQTHKPAFEVWRQSISWAMPITIISAAVGGGGSL